jgi:hypothetical protein
MATRQKAEELRQQAHTSLEKISDVLASSLFGIAALAVLSGSVRLLEKFEINLGTLEISQVGTAGIILNHLDELLVLLPPVLLLLLSIYQYFVVSRRHNHLLRKEESIEPGTSSNVSTSQQSDSRRGPE